MSSHLDPVTDILSPGRGSPFQCKDHDTKHQSSGQQESPQSGMWKVDGPLADSIFEGVSNWGVADDVSEACMAGMVESQNECLQV